MCSEFYNVTFVWEFDDNGKEIPVEAEIRQVQNIRELNQYPNIKTEKSATN